MKYLLINKCDNPNSWYSSVVGTVVPYLGESKDFGYIGLSEEGVRGYISFDDAELIIITKGTHL